MCTRVHFCVLLGERGVDPHFRVGLYTIVRFWNLRNYPDYRGVLISEVFFVFFNLREVPLYVVQSNILVLVRSISDRLGSHLLSCHTGQSYEVAEVGVMRTKRVPVPKLQV